MIEILAGHIALAIATLVFLLELNPQFLLLLFRTHRQQFLGIPSRTDSGAFRWCLFVLSKSSLDIAQLPLSRGIAAINRELSCLAPMAECDVYYPFP